MLHPPRISWPLALSLAVIAGILALLPFFLSTVEDVQQSLDGGGLAAQTNGESAVLFMRTGSSELFASVLSVLTIESALSPLVGNDVYELVGARNGTGALAWTLARTNIHGHVQESFSSLLETGSLLALERSLEHTKEFRRLVSSKEREVLWVQPSVFKDASSLLYALLAPAHLSLLRLEGDGSYGNAQFFGASPTLHDARALWPFPNPNNEKLRGFFSLDSWVQKSWMALSEHDPALAEGMEGIVLSLLERVTGSTDLTGLLKDIGSEPFFLSLKKERDGSIPFVSGKMRSAAALEEWKKRVSASNAIGVTRSIDLYGENVRTDIRLNESEEVTLGDWTLTPMNTAGTYLLAVRDRQFLIGETELLTRVMTEDTRGAMDQSIDIEWMLSFLGLPTALQETFLQSEHGSMQWEIDPKEYPPILRFSFQ